MNKDQALAKMVPPSKIRPGKPRGGVIQIWLTRACDKSCFGCTQGSNLRGPYHRISLDQFETACLSLREYFGIVGIFGGNPALHPQFGEICEILRQHIPFERRGLWCNNPMGKGKTMAETFNPAVSNLNVHLDQKAYDEFKRDWPSSNPFGLRDDSRHSPVYVAMQDVIPSVEERWDLIANCDINQHWSAMVCVFRGELRGYFCEIAGAQAMLHQDNPDWPDTGTPISSTDENPWWKHTMHHYQDQVLFHCHRCGVPLRGYGSLAQNPSGIEQVSQTHEDIYSPKQVTRVVQLVTERDEVKEQQLQKFTDYLGNGRSE